MKKCNLFIALLIVIFTKCDAQVFPYLEDFETMPQFTTPQGWTTSLSGFQVYPTHGNATSVGLTKQLSSFSLSDSAITPLIGAITNNTELKFDYRVCQVSIYPASPITFVAGDKIEVKVISGNTTSTVLTIDNTNHITSSAFATKTVNLSAYAGQNISIKFVVKKANATFDCFFDFDNISVDVAAGVNEISSNTKPILVPNVIKSNQRLKLLGIKPGNYKVSIFSISGELISSSSIELTTENEINSGILNNGYYLLKIENDNSTINLKFNVQ